MDLAAFKARYPQFLDDAASQVALDDAAILVLSYNVPAAQQDLAQAYLAAHILTVPNGVTEQSVKKAKADTVEVEFSEKTDLASDWLARSSYGLMFRNLIVATPRGIGIFVA